MPTPPQPLRANLRSQWLLSDNITFLNHGSFGAVPRVVFEEQTNWRRRIEADPIELLGRRSEELIRTAKLSIGAFLGMREPDFGLVTNATGGVNAVLHSLTLRPGDELLTTTHVYNAVRQSMRLLAQRSGASINEIDLQLPIQSAEEIASAVLDAISPRTRLVMIDHITSPSALVFPVEQIIAGCKARGVEILVDGAHAPGMLPLNIEELQPTYYAGNLHKWTCAPKGSAFLWVHPDRQSNVHPLIISHNFKEPLAREFAWQGTRDISAWLSIPKAIEFMSTLGWDNVMAHNHNLATWAQSMLCDAWNVNPISPLEGQLLGSMATIPLPGALQAMTEPQCRDFQQDLYTNHKIEVPLLRLGNRQYTRPCCQVYNTPSEYEHLAKTIKTIAKQGLSTPPNSPV